MLFFSYAICIRPEAGYCCVEYVPCADTHSFSLSSLHATMSKQDDLCTEDFVEIDGKYILLYLALIFINQSHNSPHLQVDKFKIGEISFRKYNLPF